MNQSTTSNNPTSKIFKTLDRALPFNTTELPKVGGFDLSAQVPDYTAFTRTAKYYIKHGHYPYFNKNDRKNLDLRDGSEFRKFWDEERRRCREGLTINGVFMNHNLYYYLNYYRMKKVVPTPKQIELLRQGKQVGKVKRVTSFPEVWDSNWHISNYIEEASRLGKHAAVLKSRGVGFSYYLASIATNCYFHKEGGGSVYILGPSDTSLLAKDSILDRTWEQMNFIDSHTPFWKIREGGRANTMFVRRARRSKRINGKEITVGVVSSIQGIIIKDPNKFRGQRGDYVILDEAGNQDKADKIINLTRRAMEQNNAVYGTIIIGGTGGTAIKDLKAFTSIIQNPEAFNILGMKNVFARVDNGKKIPLFIGAYWNNQGYYDKFGRSRKRAAYDMEMTKRKELAEQAGKSSKTYLQYCAENAMFPEEAMMNVSAGRMPRDKLIQQKEKLLGRMADIQIGYMNIAKYNEGIFIPDSTKEPLWQFPTDDGVFYEGAVVIVHPPETNDVYYAGLDPYAQDTSSTNSHGSIYIRSKKLDTDVAYYTGRPNKSEIFLKTCIAMLRYYKNAGVLIENNVYSVISNFKLYGAEDLLLPKPKLIQKLVPKSKATTEVGMHKVNSVYQETLDYMNDWLRTASTLSELRKDNPVKTNLEMLTDIGLILELLNEQEKMNFDRLNAYSMLFLQRQELRIQDKLAKEDEGNSSRIDEIINYIRNLDESNKE